MSELTGPALRHAIEEKFEIDLSGRPTMLTMRGKSDGKDGRIHTDSETKIITLLLYLNLTWDRPEGRLRLLHSPTDLENYAREVVPVAGTMLLTNVMVVHPDVPAKTVAEFIAYAKANPGKINMASSGSGTSVHMSGELFKAMTGVNMQHVPYRGSAPAMQDLLTNRVQVMFDNLPGSMAHIKAGTLRARSA